MALIKIDIAKKLKGTEGPFDLTARFELDQGDFLGIYGKSGAGKTSILKMIAGLMEPQEGLITVNNDAWYESSSGKKIKANKRSIGYVFQEYALFPNMTVRENIAFALSNKSDPFSEELMELTGLSSLADQKPQNLSGGQQQRVALARAIARKPNILLLDEPFSSLDDAMRNKLQEITLELHERYGTTSIIVSHDIGELFKLTNRLMELESGSLREIRSADELFADRSISGKFKFTGRIIDMTPADSIVTAQILIGNNLIKVVVTKNEALELNPGDKVMVVSKAFNPMIIKRS